MRFITIGEEGREDGGKDTPGKGAREDGRHDTVEGGWEGNGCTCGAGGGAVSLEWVREVSGSTCVGEGTFLDLGFGFGLGLGLTDSSGDLRRFREGLRDSSSASESDVSSMTST